MSSAQVDLDDLVSAFVDRIVNDRERFERKHFQMLERLNQAEEALAEAQASALRHELRADEAEAREQALKARLETAPCAN